MLSSKEKTTVADTNDETTSQTSRLIGLLYVHIMSPLWPFLGFARYVGLGDWNLWYPPLCHHFQCHGMMHHLHHRHCGTSRDGDLTEQGNANISGLGILMCYLSLASFYEAAGLRNTDMDLVVPGAA
jgi:hypothetical protein